MYKTHIKKLTSIEKFMIINSSPKLYPPEATINHIKGLAFNRSVSTVGEIEGALYIKNELNKENIKCKTEYFSFIGAKRIFMRITYVFLFTYLVLYRLILVLFIYFSIKYLFQKTRTYSLVELEESKNVVSKIKAKKKNLNKPVVILSAHFDTFSANIPYNYQRILFFIFKIIILPYFLINFIFFVLIIGGFFMLDESIIQMDELIILFTTIEMVIVGIIFLLIYDNGKSKGSIDNASGVSILIELAKLFKKNPLENYDIIFLWTGAEEWGLKGSRNFCKRHRKYLSEKYDLDRSFNINIDMVGTYIGLESKNSTHFKKQKGIFNLNKMLKETAIELNIPVIKYKKIIKPRTDHLSFRSFAKKTKSSFQVALFHSYKDSKFIHSPMDTPDKCSSQNLNGCFDICYNTIRSIDSMNSYSEEIR